MPNTDPPPDGRERNALPSGLKQALEQLFVKYIHPVIEKLDGLEMSLKSSDAREVVTLREELRRCRESEQALRYEVVELKTKAAMFEDSSKRWQEKYKELDNKYADLNVMVALLESKLKNRIDGHHD